MQVSDGGVVGWLVGWLVSWLCVKTIEINLLLPHTIDNLGRTRLKEPSNKINGSGNM